MDTMTVEDLSELLRTSALGGRARVAAMELLIRSNVWLHRDSFRDVCVVVEGPTARWPGQAHVAYINWEAVGEALTAYDAGEGGGWVEGCSDGERRLIQIAYDIAAGPMSEVSMLARGDVALVLAVISHASGTHERAGGSDHVYETDPETGGVLRIPATPENSGPLFPWPSVPLAPLAVVR